MVTVVLEDGRSVPIEAGHDPSWFGANTAVHCPPGDGFVRACAIEPGTAVPFDTTLLAGNTLASAQSIAAVHRTDPRRVLLSNGRTILGATDPAVSDDGVWLAYIRPDEPFAGAARLMVERVDGSQAPRQLAESARSPRFGGTTLAWEVGHGQIAACADVANPAVQATAFPLPAAWSCSKPVPVWVPTRGELIILFIADAGAFGEIKLATFGSLAQGAPRGYALGESAGSAYDHDARPVGLDQVRVQWLDPAGLLDGLTVTLTGLRATLQPPAKPEPPPPPVPPPVLPDIPWTTDPHGVIEDVWPWIANNATALSPDGRVAFILKSDEVSADGVTIGEWWDHDDRYIGHLEDASTGHRIYQGKRYLAVDWVALGQPVPWASLPLARNRFNDGARLWLPRRCVSGAFYNYVTDIQWNNGYVQPNIHIQIQVDVGYARFGGREAFVRGKYIPGGNAETNYYGPSGWVKWSQG